MKYFILFIMLFTCNTLIVSAGHGTVLDQVTLDHNLFTSIIFRSSFNYSQPPLPRPPCDNIKSLLELKANLHAQDKWGNKSLDYAQKFNDTELITLLRQLNQRINATHYVRTTRKSKRNKEKNYGHKSSIACGACASI